MKNPDILTLFQQKKIAAAWVPEPWLTRLLYEAGGKLFLDERSLWKDGKFTTAVVVVRSDFLAKNRELVKRFIATHVDITEWARKEPVKAQAAFNREFGVITRKPMNEKTLADLSKRLLLTTDPLVSSLVTSAGNAASLGFLPVAARDTKKVAAACDLSILNEVLKERKLPTIR
jgi:NitT/TauT family transport system substrate-binding protein